MAGTIGTWQVIERSQTGETQYMIARLEQGNGDPQQLTNNTSTPINVSGYTGGNISIVTLALSFGTLQSIFIEGSLDGVNFFEVSKLGPELFVSPKPYSVKWGGLPLKFVQIKVENFNSSTTNYITLVANA